MTKKETNVMAAFTSFPAKWMLRILFATSSVYSRLPKMKRRASFRVSCDVSESDRWSRRGRRWMMSVRSSRGKRSSVEFFTITVTRRIQNWRTGRFTYAKCWFKSWVWCKYARALSEAGPHRDTGLDGRDRFLGENWCVNKFIVVNLYCNLVE